jgi:hypothetical protein
MESSLEIGFLRASEKAAIAAARTMGYGKRKYSDQVAVEAMREELNKLKMRGSIVIGEGERDKAPMLFVGEPLGRGWAEAEIFPEVDIAVDPLEGTNLCATGSANSIAVIAASEKGGLLNAPDIYMDKIVVGPTAADAHRRMHARAAHGRGNARGEIAVGNQLDARARFANLRDQIVMALAIKHDDRQLVDVALEGFRHLPQVFLDRLLEIDVLGGGRDRTRVWPGSLRSGTS